MNTDNIFLIGKSHKICQDYTYSDDKCIIVADGCSSSENSDIGARILVQCAKEIFKKQNYLPDYKELGYRLITQADLIVKTLDININCLDSTLIICEKFPSSLSIYMYGDGIILANYKDKIEKIKVDFPDNAPYYLSYWIDPKRQLAYFDKYNDIDIKIIGEPIYDGSFGSRSYDKKLRFSFPLDNLLSLIISTDGLSTFLNMNDNKIIDLDQIAKEIITFKTTKGEFLKRRVLKACEEYRKQNIYHLDDIGLAAITF